MSTTYQTWFRTTLALPLSSADTTMEVATAPTITQWRVLVKQGNTKEWIKFTWVSWTTLTGLTRWLSQTADPITWGTGEDFIAWATIKIVAMHDQLQDRTFPVATVYATTAARDTALWADWAATEAWIDIYVTATWFYYNYNLSTGQWETVDTGTATPNASTTVAGKVETATSAEWQAWTNTGWTWANLIVLPGNIAANTQSSTFIYAEDSEVSDTYVISLTPNLTAYTKGQTISFEPNTTNTWACTINVDWLWAKDIKLIDWTDPLDWDVTAWRIYDLKYDGTNFVLQQVPERATNAEAMAWTDETNYITPYHLKNYQKKLWNWLSRSNFTTYTASTDWFIVYNFWWNDSSRERYIQINWAFIYNDSVWKYADTFCIPVKSWDTYSVYDQALPADNLYYVFIPLS